MREDARAKKVMFVDRGLFEAYEKLKDGTSEEIELYGLLTGAFKELEKNPAAGTKVPSANWPKLYVKKYSISSLYKYDLTRAWRLVYTLEGSKIEVIAIILEWFDSHKNYEKRFGYKKK